MNPLEEATVDDLITELSRRFPDMVFVGERACPGEEKAMHGATFVRGSTTKGIGMLRIAQLKLEQDILDAEIDEDDIDELEH